MKRWLIRLVCPVVAAVLPLGPALAQDAPARRPLKRFDTIMEDLLRKHRVAGAALAIAVDGKLVLARGYGLANVAANEPVRPNHLFCTGSVTKSVTAVAVLHLVEQGKLALDDPMMVVLKDLKPLGEVVDRRLRKVTVRQLLNHSGGWDERTSGRIVSQPMLRRARARGIKGRVSDADWYRLALSEQRLDFDPGTECRYHNFGFIILRLVIEQASGQPYEKYVRQEVLAPMGIRRMRLELTDYGPDEVRRYDVGGRKELRGGYPIHPGDTGEERSGGNWMASAPDLVRFLTALDGSRGKPFLKRKTMAQMLALPPPPFKRALRATDVHFGLGWDVAQRVGQAWRYGKAGGRPGVSAWIEHQPDGVDWAVVFNTSSDKESKQTAVSEARKRIPEAINQVRAWPARDLFKGKAK
jgi:CubicO group peptidase (beta-lactamase class C family)